jgi:cytochrome P450
MRTDHTSGLGHGNGELIDVSDPQLYEDDVWQPLFARLRREAPVYFCPQSRYGPYWSITRYADIMAVETDHAAFSSQLGGIQVEDQPKGQERPSFIRMDPPRHTQQRRTVAPVAAPSNLAHYETIIRARTQRVLDSLPRNTTFDWVDLVAIELTGMMLATLFDFPFAERRKLTYWSDVAIADVHAADAVVRSETDWPTCSFACSGKRSSNATSISRYGSAAPPLFQFHPRHSRAAGAHKRLMSAWLVAQHWRAVAPVPSACRPIGV